MVASFLLAVSYLVVLLGGAALAYRHNARIAELEARADRIYEHASSLAQRLRSIEKKL